MHESLIAVTLITSQSVATHRTRCTVVSVQAAYSLAFINVLAFLQQKFEKKFEKVRESLGEFGKVWKGLGTIEKIGKKVLKSLRKFGKKLKKLEKALRKMETVREGFCF